MSNLKSSNFLLACLLSGKASLLLMAPVQAISSSPSPETSLKTAIEVEVVNLKVNSTERSGEVRLVANADNDQNVDQNVDQNQDVNNSNRNWRA
ncbi:hypothetical protein PMG71_17155 [Roseofilum sp. BLCC_M154]|uniref:Uncharacterized protein n=1 Tax=Roseofilum acuticapitatum BLCC-M154 TaxID=3022444 RepID=A0ABT7AW69_9CYAN|nr:hypothetical protein [Roseofilum acuticapitatum]MDJ1171159.1 hypothetical protein [Roseofilum acuticapitatum BLCC-M154]